jgi:hypothetical protein
VGEQPEPLPLRRTFFGLGGFRPEDVEALQAWHESQLAEVRHELAKVRVENADLGTNLRSARLALAESTGWSERLPVGLAELARLAAGTSLDEQSSSRLAAAVLALAGDHLIAAVELTHGDPTGELTRATTRNDNGRPIRTVVALGGCVVDCTWQPAVDAGEDTTRIVEGLCAAVVCSLAGVAASRVERHLITQLGDERAYRRHLALRARLDQPAATIDVLVDPHSQLAHSALYGQKAWEAALARAAGELERVARAHGGQAYHVSDLAFVLLVDRQHVDAAAEQAGRELADYDGLVFAVGEL